MAENKVTIDFGHFDWFLPKSGIDKKPDCIGLQMTCITNVKKGNVVQFHPDSISIKDHVLMHIIDNENLLIDINVLAWFFAKARMIT